MFGGWVQYRKSRMFVEIAVIDGVDHLFDMLFEDSEINTHAQAIQGGGANGDLDLPVVAMRFLAVSWIVT